MGPALELRGRWLLALFPSPVRSLGWALIGGGFRTSSVVAWRQVRGEELEPPVDPVAFLRHRLEEDDLKGAVAMMTSRRLERFVESFADLEGEAVHAVATVGLGNALAAGDPATASLPSSPGTINILCHVPLPLTDAALVESVALVAEARTAALFEMPVSSPLSGRPASGTGTDCIVVTCPPSGDPTPYAGKHGPVGAAIGAAVRSAVAAGARDWQADKARNRLQLGVD